MDARTSTQSLFDTRPSARKRRHYRRPAQVRAATLRLDDFAEALAENGDLRAVAAQLGIGHAYANALLQRIRRRLGSQAR